MVLFQPTLIPLRPIPLMTLRRLLATHLAFTLLLPALALHAAAEDEEEMIDLGIYSGAKNTLKFGFRMVTGAKVHFGNLGSVPFSVSPAGLADGEISRFYNDGLVRKDTVSINESDSTGHQTSTPGGRYLVFSTTTGGQTLLNGDFISYTPGLTRDWNYSNASQLVNGGTGIALSLYGAVSDGAGAEGKRRMSDGIELQLERVLGKLGGRWEVSLVGGLALSSITSKQAGVVQSSLHVFTDVYSLNGQTAPAAPFVGSTSYRDLVRPDGTIVSGGYETTVPLVSTPDPSARTETLTPGAVSVNGAWRVRGAYYVMRLGSEVRAMLTKDVGLSAGLGLSGAYVGTTYSAVESITVPGVDGPISTDESTTRDKLLPGFYANMDALWQLNERTGLYGGLIYENYGGYDQSVGGRSAKIDLGSTLGVHGGISIKF